MFGGLIIPFLRPREDVRQNKKAGEAHGRSRLNVYATVRYLFG